MANFLGKEGRTSDAWAGLSYVCSLVRRLGSSSCSCRIWGRASFWSSHLGARARTTSPGGHVCARDHLIQSVTGRTTGGFPLLQLWRPKALEHCDGKPTGVAGYDGQVARVKAERSRSIGRETRGETAKGAATGSAGEAHHG